MKKLILFLSIIYHISANSQVGIGTINPERDLHIAGANSTIRIDGLNEANNVNNDGILLSNCNADLFNSARASGLSVEDSCQQSCGIRYCHELNPKVFPTPIYETLFGLIACGLIWLYKHKFTIPGTIFFPGTK